jgi:hypothetical protein
MQTNTISITTKAPTLSKKNIKAITDRISELHPRLNESGVNQYLCDLLNLNSVGDMEGDFLVFQEIEPAVSSKELHELAHRILAYNDGDIHKAIFSARNILNTIPKSVDDLVDYVTKQRFDEFAFMVINSSLVGAGKKPLEYNSLEKLTELFSSESEVVIDVICNAQMDHNRNTSMDSQPGITERQRMLFSAANYYLNHAIGFRCNTMWLACFLSSQYFGCQMGWLHDDGTLCHGTHFGFKDDAGMIKLVIKSLGFISEFLEAARVDDNTGRTETANLYMQTLLFTYDALMKHCVEDGDDDDIENMLKVIDAINDNDDFVGEEDRLFLLTLYMANSEEVGVSKEYLELLRDVLHDRDDEIRPAKHILSQFDAWNFLSFDASESKNHNLAPMFLRSKYDEYHLAKLSAELLSIIAIKDLSDQHNNLLRGFFENYLFVLVNENSDSMFMFDSILNVAVTGMSIVSDLETHRVIRAMAELGHTLSIQELRKTATGNELAYWNERIELIESVN